MEPSLVARARKTKNAILLVHVEFYNKASTKNVVCLMAVKGSACFDLTYLKREFEKIKLEGGRDRRFPDMPCMRKVYRDIKASIRG
jgi:hypothetical protein